MRPGAGQEPERIARAGPRARVSGDALARAGNGNRLVRGIDLVDNYPTIFHLRHDDIRAGAQKLALGNDG